MKLAQIKDYWHLLEAARAGKTIQGREFISDDRWEDLQSSCFCGNPELYRIKPEVTEKWTPIFSNGSGSMATSDRQDKQDLASKINPAWVDKITGYVKSTFVDGKLVKQEFEEVG